MSFLTTLAIFSFVHNLTIQNQSKYFTPTNSSLIISSIPTPIETNDIVNIKWYMNPSQTILRSTLDLFSHTNNNSYFSTIDSFDSDSSLLWEVNNSIPEGDYFIRVTANVENYTDASNTNLFSIIHQNNILSIRNIILFVLFIIALSACCCSVICKRIEKNRDKNRIILATSNYTLRQPLNPPINTINRSRNAFMTTVQRPTMQTGVPIVIPVQAATVKQDEEDYAREASL